VVSSDKVINVSAGELDPIAILDALGFLGPARTTPVTGGLDAAIWKVERGTETYALRVLRPEQAPVATREAAAMAAAAAAGLPVPRVHAAGSWRDRPAMLLDWCPGRPVADELPTHPWRAWTLGFQMGRTQAAIHDLAVPDAFAETTSWRNLSGENARLQAWLDRVPARAPALLHLDYHPLNVLADGARLSAVLDWANARPGDPRADLARTVSILRLAPLPVGPVGAAARGTIRLLEAGWRRGYEQTAGPMGDMRPFYAWAGAMMERDLAQHVGHPGAAWLTEAHMDRIRRWRARWMARADEAKD